MTIAGVPGARTCIRVCVALALALARATSRGTGEISPTLGTRRTIVRAPRLVSVRIEIVDRVERERSMTMDRVELVRCMREAAEALAEFRHFIPLYCPEAVGHLEQALRHFDVALALCERSDCGGHGGGGDGGDDPDNDDDNGGDDDTRPPLRITW